jgi:hypothetical protein
MSAIKFIKSSVSGKLIRPQGYGYPTGLNVGQLINVEVLLVGAGGGGGADDYGGGGGGAGGIIYKSLDQPDTYLTNRTLRITIPAGAAAPTSYTNGIPASNTYFGNLVAYGGGTSTTTGDTSGARTGGSGAGASHGSGTPTQRAGGASIQDNNNGGTGYGNAGGTTNYATPNYETGSGGGAGAVGTTGGTGGIGRQFNITGTNTYYAGGGGCYGLYQSSETAGGSGGGGSAAAPYTSKNGTANSGGGGGGVSRPNGYGGNGGSGIAILKIKDPFSAVFSSGVTYTANTSASPGNTIYTITATSTVSETVKFLGPNAYIVN